MAPGGKNHWLPGEHGGLAIILRLRACGVVLHHFIDAHCTGVYWHELLPAPSSSCPVSLRVKQNIYVKGGYYQPFLMAAPLLIDWVVWLYMMYAAKCRNVKSRMACLERQYRLVLCRVAAE